MVNSEIAMVLKTLYSNLVNEIDNQNAGRIDENTQILADCVKNSIKHTYNQYCEPEDKMI